MTRQLLNSVHQCGFSKPAFSFLHVFTSFLTDDDDDDDDVNADGHFYIALFSAFEQTECSFVVCDSK